MTSPAVSIQPDAPVAIAARVMQDRRVRRLPVVARDGLLIGIVSRTDLLSVYERPDGDIRDEVLREIIAREFGLDPAEFEVTASSGVVTLAGRLARLDTAWRYCRASATPRAWSRSATGCSWRGRPDNCSALEGRSS